jgi:TonB family protein
MLSIPIIAEPLPGGAHRRRSARQKIETLVYADFGPGNGGFPINVSEGGMAFQGIQPLEKGQVIRIRFKLPSTSDTLETTGQVAWLNELGKGGGLQFIDLPEEARPPIVQWMALQTQPGDHTENVSDGSPQVKKKDVRSSPSLPPAGHDSNSATKTKTNSTLRLPPSILSSATAAEATASGKSAAGFLSSADAAQAMFGAAGRKRTWIMPFTIGVITSLAIMIAIMISFGVISVQFNLPQRAAGENPAPPAARSGVANVLKLPSEKTAINESVTNRSAAGPQSLTVPSATSTQVPTAEPAPSRLTPSDPPPARTATPKINSPKPGLQNVTTAKLTAPRSMTPARPAEPVPPAFALPTKPELAPQLPVISSQSATPAPPISAPARQSGNFDAPQLITRKDPVYPPVAKGAGISGPVELQFTVTAEGNVRDVSVVKGNPLLVRAAVEALQAWHYQPARLNGIAIEAQSTTVFNFKAN